MICTISPAQSQLEMTRNTLLFAAHAKNVSNQATINTVVSKDALLRQYQNEIKRLHLMLKRGANGTLEAELRAASEQRDVAQVRDHEGTSTGRRKEGRESSHFPCNLMQCDAMLCDGMEWDGFL